MSDIEKCVEEVLEWFAKAQPIEQHRFITTPRENLIMYYHTLGRNIRNNLKIWENKWEEEIVDGVDVSPNHPDAISMRIIEEVWDKLKRG